MRITNVLLSTKKTALEYYKEYSDTYEELLLPGDIQKIKRSHEEHYTTLDFIKKLLSKKCIKFDRAYMPYSEYKDFENRDLIISIGGDGTVLNSSHYILDNTPILCIKSDIASTGALCSITKNESESALEKVLEDKFHVEAWTRLEGYFNKKRVLSLNEIFVGPKFSVGTGRYTITFKDTIENQISSGIVVTTGAGSTGWYKNIPGKKSSFPRDSKELRFCVREYLSESKYTLTEGIIKNEDVLIIKSGMDTNGCISFDADVDKRLFTFNRGKTIEIRIAETPLCVITFGR